MVTELREELERVFINSFQPPFNGGIKEWAEANIVLPSSYAIPGKLNLELSPYLLQPLKDIDDPKVTQINCAAATQTAKSLLQEIFIPYSVVNNPKPLLRVFHNNDISATFAETRLIPLLKGCGETAKLLKYDRFATKKTAINFPHVSIIMKGSNEGIAHGLTIGYLLCEELHQWDIGMFNKFVARTTAFAGRRKIICSSQPNEAGSEWESICNKGLVYEWHWQCPKCDKHQPFQWSKRRPDDSFCGFNWDTVLNADGETTNIDLSANTTWLECEFCRNRVNDTPEERYLLNKNGQHLLVKSDGDTSIHTYIWPNFVNVNLSFKSAAVQYMLAKKALANGLDEQMKIFVTQVLGRFYKQEASIEFNKMVQEIYEKDNLDKNWVKILTVDVQRSGIKYFVCRAWNKNGNESRLIDFGVVRKWEEVEELRKKHGILTPLVGIDSGDGTAEIYQTCIRYGQVLKVNNSLQYISWIPLKGDGAKTSYKHSDGISRLYSPISPQDCQWPSDSKFKGITAPLRLWSNASVKTILANLRDNKINGVKWAVDTKDNDYITHLYSEGLKEVIDKKTGLTVQRWIQIGQDNHFYDCENMNLAMAIMAGVFSPTEMNETEVRKLFNKE